jgi:transcriptional regulator with XRE-family HTH domain
MGLIRWDRVDVLARGMTDKELAKRVGMSPSALSQIRNGGRPGFEARWLIALAAALGCSVAYLIGESDFVTGEKSEASEESLAIAVALDQLPEHRRAEAKKIFEAIRVSEEASQNALRDALQRIASERGEDIAEQVAHLLTIAWDDDLPGGDGIQE